MGIISYKKLWKILIDRNMVRRDLREACGLSTLSMSKLTKGQNISTDILVRICDELHCDISDICEIVRDEADKTQGMRKMGELTSLPNIAAKLEVQLADIGITTVEQLKEIGSREAWLRILAHDPSACINSLCALEGAIQGVRWHYLDDETKNSLKAFCKSLKGSIKEKHICDVNAD